MKQRNPIRENSTKEIVFILVIVSIAGIIVLTAGCLPTPAQPTDMKKFSSNAELLNAFKDAQSQGYSGRNGVMMKALGAAEMAGAMAATAVPQAAMDSSVSAATGSSDYSKTNVQVEGVDEADIVKNDGLYIYYVKGNMLIIAKAYPAENAEIVSITNFTNAVTADNKAKSVFNPQEIFIDKDRMIIFGSSQIEITYDYPETVTVTNDDGGEVLAKTSIAPPRYPYYSYRSSTTVKVLDISDRSNPNVIKTYDFEGDYLSSRKIGTDVYFVIQSYPDYQILQAYDANATTTEEVKCIAPTYSESNSAESSVDFQPIAKCTDISYIPPIRAQNFISVISVSINLDRDLQKEVIVGSGQEIYASLSNLYIVSPKNIYFPRPWLMATGSSGSENIEKTEVSKFSLDNGKVTYQGSGEVPGHILNQFSMDEYDGNFRIATTVSGYENTPTGGKDTSTNNMYVLSQNMSTIGRLEGVAPGESIYSVRFMGKRAYMVTFKHVDPLFVIDLSDPANPAILGKLKIPGYSDYLHPYDETHLIGIGKEVDESIDADKVHTEGAVYYTAIQGVKIAIFDVSDVSNPIEMYKEVIGDRGTESLATSEHKAFLFDKEKQLLVVPMTVAELKAGQDKSMEGEFTFQGAYVYNVNLQDGFKLKGRVSHIDDQQEYLKSGYYFRSNGQIVRSLYIDDVLYTISNLRIQANELSDLSTIKKLDLPQTEEQDYYYYGRGVMIE